MLFPGALRLLYLQLVVDDGDYVNRVRRADAATDHLAATMRRQSVIMRQYRRDMAITAGAGAVAIGMLARNYAQVEETALRTVFAEERLGDTRRQNHILTRAAIADSMSLSKAMGLSVKRAQELELSIAEAGITGQAAQRALAESAVALSRATGGAVSETEAFTTTYRLLKTTLNEGQNLETAAEAAALYASQIAIAGNKSAAGIETVRSFVNAFKDMAIAVPMTTEEVIALSAATADLSENNKEAIRTAFMRLYAKGSTADFATMSSVIMRRADPTVLEQFNIGGARDLERLRSEDPIGFLFTLSSAVRSLQREYNPATGRFEGGSIAEAKVLQEQLKLRNIRDLIGLAELSVGYEKYTDVLSSANEETRRFIEGGAGATSVMRFNSAWLDTLTGQWNQFGAAVSRAGVRMNETFGLLTALPMALGVGMMGGVADSGALTSLAVLGGAGLLAHRMRGIRAVRNMQLDALLNGPERTAGALARAMGVGGPRGLATPLPPGVFLSRAHPTSIYGLAAAYGTSDLANMLFTKKGTPRRLSRAQAGALDVFSARTWRVGESVDDVLSFWGNPATFGRHGINAMGPENRGFLRNLGDDALFMAAMMGGGLGRRGGSLWNATGGRLLALGGRGRTLRALRSSQAASMAASQGMNRLSVRGAGFLARLPGMGGTTLNLLSRGAAGRLAFAGGLPVVGTVLTAVSLLAPVFRGLGDAMTGLAAKAGPLAGVLRIVRFIFRTLELVGNVVGKVFDGIGAALSWLWEKLSPILGPAGQFFNDTMDRIDQSMVTANTQLAGAQNTPASASTRQEREALVAQQNNHINIVSNTRDSDIAALQQARLLTAGSYRYITARPV